MAGMGDFNVEDFQLLLRDQPAWEEKTERDRQEMLGWNAELLKKGYATLCSEVDRAALTDDVAEFLLDQMKEGVRTGFEGLRDDGLSQILPWGFDLRTIHAPVQVWHGGQDRFVPVAHGKWIAARISNVEAHIEPGEGHVTLVIRRISEIQRWIVSKF